MEYHGGSRQLFLIIWVRMIIMKGIKDTKTNLPKLKNDGRMCVYLQGNYFKQNVATSKREKPGNGVDN